MYYYYCCLYCYCVRENTVLMQTEIFGTTSQSWDSKLCPPSPHRIQQRQTGITSSWNMHASSQNMCIHDGFVSRSFTWMVTKTQNTLMAFKNKTYQITLLFFAYQTYQFSNTLSDPQLLPYIILLLLWLFLLLWILLLCSILLLDNKLIHWISTACFLICL